MKIFLIGFMGAGKSTVGKALATRMKYPFLDLDTVLEAKEGVSVQQIFERQGESFFRTLEAAALRNLSDMEEVIVATGGGLPCFHHNMSWMNKNGVTIFLDVPVAELVARLAVDSAKRPLLRGKTSQELSAYVAKTLADRKVYYDQAHFTCHAEYPVDELARELAAYFGRFSSKK